MAVTSVDSTTTSTSLLDAGRSGGSQLVIENSDENRLFVLLDDGAASASNYSFSLAQYENARLGAYNGPINGVWETDGAGAAHVTVA